MAGGKEVGRDGETNGKRRLEEMKKEKEKKGETMEEGKEG